MKLTETNAKILSYIYLYLTSSVAIYHHLFLSFFIYFHRSSSIFIYFLFSTDEPELEGHRVTRKKQKEGSTPTGDVEMSKVSKPEGDAAEGTFLSSVLPNIQIEKLKI